MTIATFVHDEPVQKMLHDLDTALNPIALAGFMAGIVDPYLRGRASDRFFDEGDDVTGTWAPLAPSTQNIRATLGYGAAHPINVRTGELERYITQEEGNVNAHPWGASVTLPGRPASGELQDKLEHAQAGGIGQSGRSYPARPVLGMNTRDLAFVLLALAEYFRGRGTPL